MINLWIYAVRTADSHTTLGALTVTFNHEWFDDIVSDHLKVGVSDPVADGSLGTGKEVINDRNFMAQEHETVDEVGSNETSAASNQDTLALRWRQQLHGRESREGGIGDSMALWVEDGLGLVGCKALGEFGMQFFLPCILLREFAGARGSQDIMGAKIERSKKIDGDFTIEAKTIEANGLDFLSGFVQNFYLVR